MPDVSISGNCLGRAIDEDFDLDSEVNIQVSPQHSIQSLKSTVVSSMEACGL